MAVRHVGPQAYTVYRALKERIVSGELLPDQRLPPQSDLAAEYGVAVLTLRQALSRLEQEGLVSSEHGRGTFVRARLSQAQKDALTLAQTRVVEMISAGTPISDVLDTLLRHIESQAPGLLGSILLLDEDGQHLRHGAAPSLPQDYNEAVDGFAVGPVAGSCGTAVYRREQVVVSDIAGDPLWADYRDVALMHRLRACWSTPILDDDGEILGTFALYYREPRHPGPLELELIARSTQIAAIAIKWKRYEERLAHQALHDPLTGLPNRTLLLDRLQQAILAAERDSTSVALLLLDLDRFREINDALGHSQADQVLQEVAARLRESVRDSDTVSRLGGDEFALVLAHTSALDAGLSADKLLVTLQQPLIWADQQIHVGGSLGIALYPEHGEDAATLMQRADAAMYAAKRSGSGYAYFVPRHSGKGAPRLRLVRDLRRAIEQDDLVLHYQAKQDLRTSQVVAAEALVRWKHRERGLVPPADFVPLAEQTGLIEQLTAWVLNEALRQAAAWHAAGLVIEVSVNLSARSLHDPYLMPMVTLALKTWQAEPAWLCVEITESDVMADPEASLNILTQLRDMGIRISIDDFGTGYSSLAYLRRLPVAEIKIDRAFVSDMTSNENDRRIAQAIIALAHQLDLMVVAEGVPDEEARLALAGMGCDLAQGHFLGPPMAAEEFVRRCAGRARCAGLPAIDGR